MSRRQHQNLRQNDTSDLAYLIEHTNAIDGALPLNIVEGWFRTHAYEYAAVTSGKRVIGLLSRSHVTSLLSGRYGFALHNRVALGRHMVADALVANVGMSLRDLLGTALSRPGDAFYHDVVLVHDDGSLAGLVSTQRLVAAQSELVREHERRVVARGKTELLETLVGGIAHEINNKLTPIVGFAELLKSNDEHFDDYRRTIHQAALDASRIIRQLLQLSRPTVAELVACDLRDLVHEGLKLLRLRFKEAHISFSVQVPDEPVVVVVDPVQIKQVVINLGLNAFDAMAGVERRHFGVTVATKDGAAVIEISDTGIGIAPQYLDKIFDPFYTTKGPREGTGLGLSVSCSIARLHGGDISVRSAVNCGSTFYVTLPLADVQLAAPVEPRAMDTRLRHVRPEVLVVEDDDAVAAFLTRLLQVHLSGDVLRVSDGVAAQLVLSTREFDLIVSDIRMPRWSGVDLFRWIQAERPHLADRLLFVTGDASGSPLNTALEESGVQVMRKPLTADALLQRARAIIDDRPDRSLLGSLIPDSTRHRD